MLIDEASVAFSPGFNVITGDSGAGKSVLLLALNQVCRLLTTHSQLTAVWRPLDGAFESVPHLVHRLSDGGCLPTGSGYREVSRFFGRGLMHSLLL